MGISQIGVSSSGVSVRRTAFTSSGSWTAPTGVSVVKVFLVGGGGGGGGHITNVGRTQQGGGGGGGQVIEKYLNVTPGTSYTITIGAGGSAGGASATKSLTCGGVGGDSSFGSLLTAYGGGSGGNYQQGNGAQPRMRYSVGGETGDGSQGANSGMSGGGGGAGIPFQGLISSEINNSTYNDGSTSHPLGQGGHGAGISGGGNNTASIYAYSVFQGKSYSKWALRHLNSHGSVDDGSFTSDTWYGGSLGGIAPPEWTAGLSTFRAGKGAGGFGGITGIGFGGGGGGGSWYLNSGSSFTIQGTLPTGSTIGSGRGNDGGGDGALAYYQNTGATTYNATAGAANTGGGGGGCSTYGSNLYVANSAAGGSGYCVVEWIE